MCPFPSCGFWFYLFLGRRFETEKEATFRGKQSICKLSTKKGPRERLPAFTDRTKSSLFSSRVTFFPEGPLKTKPWPATSESRAFFPTQDPQTHC